MNPVSKFIAIGIVALPMSFGAAIASANWGAKTQHVGHHKRAPLNLNTDQVKTLAKARLIRMGREELEVGKVEAEGSDSYKVTLNNQKGQTVFSYVVSKETGWPKRKTLNLTEDQATTLAKARLIMRGKADQYTLGKTSKEGDNYLVPLLNKEGKVVKTLKINPNHPFKKHHKG